MSENTLRRPRLNLTRTLPVPNAYTLALDGEFAHVAFNEERAPLNRGKWRSEIFKSPPETPLDVEIGTGAGTHFAHYAKAKPDRLVVGLEVKYKPLIQTIRRAIVGGSKNAAVARYHAFDLKDLFEPGEVDNVFIHFPDPWTSPKKPRNRLVSEQILKEIHELQKPGSLIEFKTDSREYFLWALEEIARSPYKVLFQTLDLHAEPAETAARAQNFMTTFEKIFVRQNIPINYILLLKE